MTDLVPRHIALFGGSFNPPHVCHSLATLWVLQTQPVDEVWWIPTFQHAFDKALVAFNNRLTMCELATQDLHRVRVDDIERTLGGESRTIDTVRALIKREPHCRFSLVIGADILAETARWKNWEGLMELVELIVVGRRGYDDHRGDGDDQPSHTMADAIDLELPDISSTLIRDALAECDYDTVGAWIPRSVLGHISEHRLYLGEECL